jgi:hypothetical protein
MIFVSTIDPWFVRLNLFEAGLWFVVALLMVFRFKHIPLAVMFAMFGISDIIETQTGAWYRPWWLLLLKTFCVLGIAWMSLMLWRKNRPQANTNN